MINILKNHQITDRCAPTDLPQSRKIVIVFHTYFDMCEILAVVLEYDGSYFSGKIFYMPNYPFFPFSESPITFFTPPHIFKEVGPS